MWQLAVERLRATWVVWAVELVWALEGACLEVTPEAVVVHVNIQVDQFQSVHSDDLRLAPNVYLEGLVAIFNYSERTFIVETGTVGVATDEYKLGLLKLSWNRDWCHSVSGGRNRG